MALLPLDIERNAQTGAPGHVKAQHFLHLLAARQAFGEKHMARFRKRNGSGANGAGSRDPAGPPAISPQLDLKSS